MAEVKIIQPQEGMQELMVRSNCDVIFAGGAMNSGKSYAAILSIAEMIQDPDFCAVFLRRTLNETKVGGGLFQEMKGVYKGEIKTAKESDNPRITFQSGAICDFSHISDENPSKLLERIRGWQYSMIYFDEGTSYEWSTFRLLFSRNRSKSRFKSRILLTCNPRRNHWLRRFLNDYIGADGFIKPDWDGRVRYFFIKGKNVEDVVWGDSYEEVYEKCKLQIDEAITRLKSKDATYKSLIKSFVFYLGSTAQNKASIGKDAAYLGSVAAMGDAEYRANLLGNWNVANEDDEAPISNEAATNVYMNDPQDNRDKWITADLADTGTDNFLAIAWSGFHIIDILILTKTTPKKNAEALHFFAVKHGVADSHIIYDAIRGTYINDYIEEAVPFVSYRAPMGMYGRLAYNLKAECYLRLVKMINDGRLSMSDTVAYSRYIHHNLHQDVLVMTEFIEECSVVRFKDMPSGKKQLLSKKEMNALLGKGRSMDLLDPVAMRMLPVLDLPYGDELTGSMPEDEEKEEEDENIYEDNFWA